MPILRISAALAAATMLAGVCAADSLDFVLSSGNDDAHSNRVTSATTVSDTIVHLGDGGFGQQVDSGYRFATSGIARGQVIQAAQIRLYVEVATIAASGTFVFLYADKTVDSPDFSGANPNPSDRLATSATANRTYASYGGGAPSFQTRTIDAAVIQEAIDQNGWDIGDPITILMQDLWSSDHTKATAYEGNPANAARLTIDFDPAQFRVLSGATGAYVLGSTGASVNFTGASSSTGTLTVARTTGGPGGTFSGGSALSPDGTTITPDNIGQAAWWTITPSGLSGFAYTVTLDTTGFGGISDADKLVVLKRPNSGSPWTPLDTTRSGSLLSAAGLTSFSDFAIGSNSSFNPLPVAVSQYGVD